MSAYREPAKRKARPEHPGAPKAWHRGKPWESHFEVWAAAERILSSPIEGERREKIRLYLEMYGGIPLGDMPYGFEDALGLNVARNMVNAAQAQICKSRPKPEFLTCDGDFSLQRRAANLGRFCEGMFAENDIPRLAPLCFRDAGIADVGTVKVFASRGRVKAQRVLPWELLAHPGESQHGLEELRTIFQVKPADRNVVIEEYIEAEDSEIPDRQAALDAAYTATLGGLKQFELIESAGSLAQTDDVIPVLEAWHLPSGPDANDGRHIICIEGATLLDEKWTRESFPFAHFSWTEPTIGAWGTSIVAELVGIQTEINYLVQTLQQSHHLVGKPKVMNPRSARVIKEQWDDLHGTFLDYDGVQKPEVVVFQCAPAEMYAHLNFLIEQAYQITGIGRAQAQSQKPGDVQSGVAIRRVLDIQSQRFAMVSRAYERFHLRIAELGIECARELAENDNGYSVTYRGTNGTQPIDFRDVDMKRDQYVMSVFPSNALSDTPAEKLADVMDLVNAKLITDRAQIFKLLDSPDLKSITGVETAPYDIVTRDIERLMNGKSIVPDPLQDLQLSKKLVTASYLRARQDNAPPGVLRGFREYLKKTDDLLNPQPSSAPADGAPPPTPPAPGAPPPDQAPAPQGLAA